MDRSSLNPKIYPLGTSKHGFKSKSWTPNLQLGLRQLIWVKCILEDCVGTCHSPGLGCKNWVNYLVFEGSNAEGWKNGQDSNHKMSFLNIFTYTWPHAQSLHTYVWLQPYSSIQTLTIFNYVVVLQLSINWICHTLWVPNPNKFINCWTGNHSNHCVTKDWDSCRSLGHTDFSLALSKHPGIPFFSRSTHKKLVWRSQGCIFEAPERICTHTRMWFMPELLIQSRNGNAATACGSFTQTLPKYHKGNLE